MSSSAMRSDSSTLAERPTRRNADVPSSASCSGPTSRTRGAPRSTRARSAATARSCAGVGVAPGWAVSTGAMVVGASRLKRSVMTTRASSDGDPAISKPPGDSASPRRGAKIPKAAVTTIHAVITHRLRREHTAPRRAKTPDAGDGMSLTRRTYTCRPRTMIP